MVPIALLAYIIRNLNGRHVLCYSRWIFLVSNGAGGRFRGRAWCRFRLRSRGRFKPRARGRLCPRTRACRRRILSAWVDLRRNREWITLSPHRRWFPSSNPNALAQPRFSTRQKAQQFRNFASKLGCLLVFNIIRRSRNEIGILTCASRAANKTPRTALGASAGIRSSLCVKRVRCPFNILYKQG
jgi:hypothetical protein